MGQLSRNVGRCVEETWARTNTNYCGTRKWRTGLVRCLFDDHECTSIFRTKSDSRSAFICANPAKSRFQTSAHNALTDANFCQNRAVLRDGEIGFDSRTRCHSCLRLKALVADIGQPFAGESVNRTVTDLTVRTIPLASLHSTPRFCLWCQVDSCFRRSVSALIAKRMFGSF